MQVNTLAKCRVLVTRAQHQSGWMAQELERRGAKVIHLPLITINPPDDWQPLDSALARIASFDWMLFASANAVDACISRWSELYPRQPAGSFWRHLKFACIGPKTTQALSRYALEASFTPASYVAEELVQAFPGYPFLDGIKIFWPRTNVGRLFLQEELTKLGATVEVATCYQTGGPEDPEQTARQLQELIAGDQINVITLASSQTVKNLKSLLDKIALPAIPEHILICSIGPETAGTARRLLGRSDIESAEYTIAGMVEALTKHASQHHL